MDLTLYEIAWMFLAYSVIGWLWETPFVSIRHKKYINRGFLRGPVIPVYGFAATTVMVSMQVIESYLIWGPVVNAIISMGYIAFVATIWEYGASYIMEELFKTRWWDYSKHRFNIKGRIALDVSFFWGIGGFLLWNFVNGPVLSFFDRYQSSGLVTIIGLMYAVLIVDAGFTLIELINLRNIVVKLHLASEEVVFQLTLKIEQLSENIGEFSDNISEQRENFSNRMVEVKETIKSRVHYRKYESFQVFGEFLEEMKDRWKNWVNDSDLSLTRYSELLGKIKKQKRFFNKYPNASSKLFELIYMIRKQDGNQEHKTHKKHDDLN